jgi:hypothetical protein
LQWQIASLQWQIAPDMLQTQAGRIEIVNANRT